MVSSSLPFLATEVAFTSVKDGLGRLLSITTSLVPLFEVFALVAGQGVPPQEAPVVASVEKTLSFLSVHSTKVLAFCRTVTEYSKLSLFFIP